jgi:hypothetical protein
MSAAGRASIAAAQGSLGQVQEGSAVKWALKFGRFRVIKDSRDGVVVIRDTFQRIAEV